MRTYIINQIDKKVGIFIEYERYSTWELFKIMLSI